MKKIKEFIYNQNYIQKIVLFLLFTVAIETISKITNYYLFLITIENTTNYHFNILTINSILSGFSLTNLGILISISGDQLVEKLKGTDILIKRNILISQSIIFGAISIFISLLFVLNININISKKVASILCDYFFFIEVFSLFLSITYFLLSIIKMIQLLSYIYIPKKPYTCDQIGRIREQMKNSVSHFDEEN